MLRWLLLRCAAAVAGRIKDWWRCLEPTMNEKSRSSHNRHPHTFYSYRRCCSRNQSQFFDFSFFFFFAFVGAFCRFCCIRWIYTLNLPIAFPMNRRGKIGRAGVGMVFAKTLLRLVRRYMYIFHQPPYNIIDFLFVKFNRKPFMAPYVQIAGNFIASRRWWEREREIERCVYVLFVHIRT